ncbi:hypothetical protein CMI48_03300 [Candidatus Pacearchaeota archaeon]|nr:hypothetical protein [Candidatus Pacearchaeota archaeon]|tara:strand:+ start:792 stop:1085 length:294 start_codon:yes stop_codon:yes gene_type:complete
MIFPKLPELLEEGFTPYSAVKSDQHPDYLEWREDGAFITAKQTSAFDLAAKGESGEYFLHHIKSKKGLELDEIEIDEKKETADLSSVEEFKNWVINN